MNVQQPDLDPRRQADVTAEILRNLPGYIPGWMPSDGSSAMAINKIFSHYMEMLARALNQAPDRSFLAFLDMLGMCKLPARPARAPLVFTLMDNAPVNVSLPASSRVAAAPQPAPASALTENTDTSTASQPVVFATEKTITLYRGHLAALYSIDPGRDQYIEHTAQMTGGFTLFDDMSLTEHIIYLGQDHLFNLAGDITVLLYFTLEGPAGSPMDVQWEYLSQSGWFALEYLEEDDTTGGFTRLQGQVKLRRKCGPNAKQVTINGRASYWIRGRLTTPLLPEGSGGKRTVPVINDISARLSFKKDDLLPEAAFADAISLDTSKDFYPFGRQPARYSTFYLASKEVFQRKEAFVTVTIELSQCGAPLGTEAAPAQTASLADTNVQPSDPPESSPGAVVLMKLEQPIEAVVLKEPDFELIWEYFDGSVWKEIPNLQSSTAKTADKPYLFAKYFTMEGIAFFSRPDDWMETTVNGAENYWLRVRIKNGNYGEPVRVDPGNPSQLLPETLQPPVISKLTLGFSYLTDPETLDHCLSYNDFLFVDLTGVCRWPDQTFKPFTLVSDVHPAVHFGFDLPLPVGLVSMYANIPRDVSESETASASPFTWEYLSAKGWTELGVLDETAGFQRSGMIQFIGQEDAVSAPGLGGNLYRLRARLKQGEKLSAAAVAGLWINTVWGVQRDSYEKELLGMSDGNPGQTFSFQHAPVLEEEVIEIQEWSGRGDGWQLALKDVPEDNLRFIQDPSSGTTAVWVRWQDQPHFYFSGATDRHYVVERATGLIRFGDGQKGMIPPAGRGIYASYRSGGGVGGNVPAGSISEPRTAAPYVMGVTNPVPASGGADIEADPATKRRGPETIRHSGRAVAMRDFEWLAREASPDIARACCLPLAGDDGHARRGWVTLLVIPQSQEQQPQPSLELRRRVCDYLVKRAPATIAGRIRVTGPAYSPISVRAEIIPYDPADAALVEARVRAGLNDFLHPLTGGQGGLGWDFGQPIYLSQIAQVIETTPGVDYAKEIVLGLQPAADNGLAQVFNEYVPVDAGTLVCAGTHEIKITFGED